MHLLRLAAGDCPRHRQGVAALRRGRHQPRQGEVRADCHHGGNHRDQQHDLPSQVASD